MRYWVAKGRLSRQEEIDLARRIRAGDLEARNELVLRNLPLVRWMARPYHRRSHDLDDLVAAGVVGLIEGANRFDPEQHGASFAAYAAHWIRKEMRDHILAEAMIRLPRWLWGPKGDVTAEEAAALGAQQQKTLRRAEASRRRPASLAALEEEQGPRDIEDPRAEDPASRLASAEQRAAILAALGGLSPLWVEIIRQRVGWSGRARSQQEIADMLGLCRKKVAEIERRALDALGCRLGLVPCARPTLKTKHEPFQPSI